MDDMQSMIGSEHGDVTGKVLWHVTISLDGFIAGPNQTIEEPLGKGGRRATGAGPGGGRGEGGHAPGQAED